MAIPTISDVAGLVSEPSIRFTQNNKPVANVRVAFNDSRFNDQTRQFETTKSFFVDCTAWEHTAERLAEHFRKGDQVYIEGRLETEQWETPQGEKRSKPNLTIRTIRKLEAAKPQQQQGGGGFNNAPQSNPAASSWGHSPGGNAWGGGQTPNQGDYPAPF